MIGVTTATVLDKRVQKADGTFAVKLRITYCRKQYYIPLGHYLTVDDWDKVQKPNARGQHKTIKFELFDIEDRASEVIRKMTTFSFDQLKRSLLGLETSLADVVALKKEYIIKLKSEGRINSAIDFESSLASFSNFCLDGRRKAIPLDIINVEWLQKYETWMLKNGKSPSTIGKYVRNLRTIFNIAIERELIPRETYPFGKRKYQIPSTKNVKKALTHDEVKAIYEYEPLNHSEARARDLWLFSYLCNGINMKDIALLKYKNIEVDKLTFKRAKTERASRSKSEVIVVYLVDQALEIIKKWGKIPLHPDNLVFDFVDPEASLDRQAQQIRNATLNVNKYMKRIRLALGIPIKVTTYSARHSFATVLKRSGASTEFISESLGHKDLKTTENYLDSFESDVKREFQKKLLDFQ